MEACSQISQNQLAQIDKQTIIDCFKYIHNPNSNPEQRKIADSHLMSLEKLPTQLLPILLEIFQTCSDQNIRFQALLYFGNVLKRSWGLRRYKQVHSAYESIKKNIKTKLLVCLYNSQKLYIHTFFDIIKFICKLEFPHAYPQFSQLVIKYIEDIKVNEDNIKIFKELKEIFYQLASRKTTTSKKYFQDYLTPILEKLFTISSSFDDQIHLSIQKSSSVNPQLPKLSKYIDQIILFTLRMGNVQLLDSQEKLMIVKQLHIKLTHLISLHSGCNPNDKQTRASLQKNIKSLIYDFGSLQSSNPFFMAPILSDFYYTLTVIISDPKYFVKPAILKYTLLGLRKIIKEFAFYSDDAVFMSSITSKAKSLNYLDLRKICHETYRNCFDFQTIQGLLNHLISNIMSMYSKNQHVSFDIDENILIDKSQQKELSIQSCTILLIQSILERFTDQAHGLIKNIVVSSYQCNFSNIQDLQIQGNIFGVLALLPRTCKKNQLNTLNDIPIIQILTYIYSQKPLKNRIPSLISGWFDYFSNDQLFSLINVLLQFIQNQSDLSLVLHCCQCLDKIIVQKKYILNSSIIQTIFPIAIQIFQKTDHPQILWPMVNLISNIITLCQFDSQIILQSLNNNGLQVLISNDSQVLVQALCDMFKNFLCVIPRHKPAQTVFRLVSHFLNNHLKMSSINSDKLHLLWYISVREYEYEHNCNQEYIQLYKSHYKNCLFHKTPILIYILEEYMLLGMIQTDLKQFSDQIYEFYVEASDEEMEKDQKQKLKIAALSFQITLITKYDLKDVNNEDMLKVILRDFYNFQLKEVSATVHNSLLSIINRYIIFHGKQFFAFLQYMNVNLQGFYDAYFQNMEYLTSETAKKINAIGILSLFSSLPNQTIISKLHYVLTTIIPPLQTYLSTQQSFNNISFTGKVQNSPLIRFASNFLSERKQQIRKKGLFQNVNLYQLFKNQVMKICQILSIDLNTIAQNFPNDKEAWAQRLYKLLG